MSMSNTPSPHTNTPHTTRDLNDMYYFARIVEEGGFSAAGRALKMSKSHLSRRLSALEARLGLRLLQRSTRQLRLTPAGERYLAYCQTIVQTAAEADQSMLGLLSQPTGEVRVSCPIGIAQISFPKLLPDFMALYPKVTVRLNVVNARVDLYRDPVDIALRARTSLDEEEGIIVRKLGVSMLHLVASKGYVEKYGCPETPGDLASHRTMSFDVLEVPPYEWRLHALDGEEVRVKHHPSLICPDMNILLDAALEGRGVALLPDELWQRSPWREELIPVLPEWAPVETILHAAYASRRGMTPAMRALLEFLTERLRAPDQAAANLPA